MALWSNQTGENPKVKINLKMLPIALFIPRHHYLWNNTNTATAHSMTQHQSLYFSLVRMIIDLTSSLHEKQMLILLPLPTSALNPWCNGYIYYTYWSCIVWDLSDGRNGNVITILPIFIIHFPILNPLAKWNSRLMEKNSKISIEEICWSYYFQSIKGILWQLATTAISFH